MPDTNTLPKPLLIDDPQRLVTFRIARLNARLASQAHRVLSQTAGISLTQWRIFASIDAMGPASAAEIARRMKLDKALISRTVSSMLKEDLLLSTPDPADQRRHVLEITEIGRATAERARHAMRHRQETLLGCMNDDQREVIFKCFDLLEETIDQMEREQ